MKVGELKLIITRIEDAVDKDGNVCLKCKGYNSYKSKINGKNSLGYNCFTLIKLYPVSQEQYEQTKERFAPRKKLKINAYRNQLATPTIGGELCAILTVYRYDFVSKKLFRKNKLLKLRKENEQ